MEKELWYFLINGQENKSTGLYGNFYAYGKDLGEALENTFIASLDHKFNSPNLMEASLLEKLDVVRNRDELLKISDTVYMRPTTYSFPFDDPDKEFIPPTGIVKMTGEDEIDYDLLGEYFVAYSAGEDGIFEFELNIGKANLTNMFINAISFLPSVDGCWIYAKEDWEDAKEQLWLGKHLTKAFSVEKFLMYNKIDTIENGFLDIVVHSITGETNLKLCCHKKIHLHTKDVEVFENFIGQIQKLGYTQTRDFYSLEFGFHHWHYKPANAISRTEFVKMLRRNKFDLVDNS